MTDPTPDPEAALRMEIAAHSVTQAKLLDAEAALDICRQTIQDQKSARIDPDMPILSREALDSLHDTAMASQLMAETREERVEAAGLVMLLEWQDKAIRERPEIRYLIEPRRR